MNGKGSAPRDQTPGPDGKTPACRYAENWEATFGVAHCAECLKPIGGTRVAAHGRDFCSTACVDAWEAQPANADALARSHAEARDLGYPHDAALAAKAR